MPLRGFDGAYFPVINKEDYLSPLIAIYFEKPMRKEKTVSIVSG